MSPVDVSLHLWGVNLDPTMISKVLKITPTRSQKTGERFESTSGKTRIAKCGMWELSSSSNLRSTCLCDHLNWMIHQLDMASVKVASLDAVDEARIDIVITSESNESTTVEFEIDRTTMNEMAAWQIPIHFTVY
ncbi:MAG: DUF4279 domain-containing protein [Gammaproteobacteria bacterium]